MNIVYEIICAAALILASFYYLIHAPAKKHKPETDSSKEGEPPPKEEPKYIQQNRISLPKQLSHTLRTNKRLAIYHLIMLAALIILIIGINSLYPYNLAAHNMKLIILIGGLVPLAWKDYYEYIIPNKVIFTMLSVRLLIYFWEFISYGMDFFVVIKDSLLAFGLIGGFLILVHIFFRNSIGMGDIKLLAVMGLYQGFAGAFSSIFFSLLSTCILSIILLVTKKKKRKDSIPFAPSVLFGTYISIFMSGT